MLAAAIAPASAGAACAQTATTKAFSQFGDSADYSLVPNGHFESGTSGWTLNGATVVSGNESYKVRSSADAKSLAIPPSAVVVSPAFCVGMEHPTFRFFARKTSGSWATMLVKLRWTDTSGATNETVVAALGGDAFGSWKPTDKLQLASVLPLWQAGQSLQVRLVFDPENSGGAWAIDDVFIDPYRK